MFSAKLTSLPSYVWRSIYSTMEYFHENLQWKVGDGKAINNINHSWVRHENRILLRGKEGLDLESKHVEWLITEVGGM